MPFEWMLSLQWWNTFSNIVFFLNIALAFFILFIERKRAASVWAWIMVLFFLPVVGFLLYLLFGKPLKQGKRRQSTYFNEEFQEKASSQLREAKQGLLPSDVSPEAKKLRDLIQMNLQSGEAPYSQNNRIQIFTDGKKKFEKLFADIEAAKGHVHLEYYILENDKLGNRVLQLLTQKAKEGVEVLFLYDALGSRKLPKQFFDDFSRAGGKANPSLPSKLPVNLRFNYRNHRKIAIIDGEAGYIGGFNIGDEYLGKNDELGYWRDTHLRVEGEFVHSLQHLFLTEWNENTVEYPVQYADDYFPAFERFEGAGMQMVASGPDEPLDQIKNGLLKLINKAETSLYIQTPYFIPDTAVLEAIRTAALSGVDVRIMIPNKPDHFFVHAASLSFVSELISAGVRAYRYKVGFLHAKTLMIDGEAFTVGSANMDVRSFSLNFEVNAFVYDKERTEEMMEDFFLDMAISEELFAETFEERSKFQHVKQRVARLVAPIL